MSGEQAVARSVYVSATDSLPFRPSIMLTATRPIVRHGEKLSYKELQEQARTVLNESDWTQHEVAEELDVTRGSVAKAVTTPGPRYRKLQMRIIALLTDYRMKREETVHFRVLRKDRIEDE